MPPPRPTWLTVGAVIYLGREPFTVLQVDMPGDLVRLGRGSTIAGPGVFDMPLADVLQGFQPAPSPGPSGNVRLPWDGTTTPSLGAAWVRVGTRLQSDGMPDAQIVGIQGSRVTVRYIEEGGLPPTLSPSATVFDRDELEQLFRPMEVPTPRWFTEDSRVVRIRDGATFQILSIDRVGASFQAHRPDEPRRIERFNLSQVEQHWRPFTSLNETFMDPQSGHRRAPVPVLSTTLPAPPPWLLGGALIRPKARDRRRSFWVASLHPDRGMCRIQRVEQFEPLKVEAQWEELAFEVAQTNWELLNPDGSPISERKCPHCGEFGGRFKEAEEASASSLRVYHCANQHVWSFIHGGSDDGELTARSRFDRDLDL